MSIIDVEAVVNIIPVNQNEDTTSGIEHDLCTATAISLHGGSSIGRHAYTPRKLLTIW